MKHEPRGTVLEARLWNVGKESTNVSACKKYLGEHTKLHRPELRMLVVDSEKDGVCVAQVSAKALDASNVKNFKDEVKPLLTPNAKLVLDMSKVDFIDSSALGALVSCLRLAHTVGGEIKLSGLRKPARALFELVRMHRVFEVFNSSEEAVGSYGVDVPLHINATSQL